MATKFKEDDTVFDVNPVEEEDVDPVGEEDVDPVGDEDVDPVGDEDVNPVEEEDVDPVGEDDVNPVEYEGQRVDSRDEGKTGGIEEEVEGEADMVEEEVVCEAVQEMVEDASVHVVDSDDMGLDNIDEQVEQLESHMADQNKMINREKEETFVLDNELDAYNSIKGDAPPMMSEEVVCSTETEEYSEDIPLDIDHYEKRCEEPEVVYLSNGSVYQRVASMSVPNVVRRVPTVSSVKMTSTGRIIKVIRGAAPRQELGEELPEEIAKVLRQAKKKPAQTIRSRPSHIQTTRTTDLETGNTVLKIECKSAYDQKKHMFPVAAPPCHGYNRRKRAKPSQDGIAEQLKRLIDTANEEDPPSSDEDPFNEEHLPLRCLPVAEQFRIARQKKKPKRKKRMVRMPKYVNEQTSRWASPAYEKVSKLVASTRDEDKPLPCPDCPSRFKSMNALRAHGKEMHGPPEALPYPCKLCPKRFLWASKLRIHEALIHKVDHGAASFRCEDCGKLCGSKIYLERHRVSHTSVRTFRCELCGSSFKSKWNLQLHLRYGACPASLRRQEDDYLEAGGGIGGECECVVCGRLYSSKGALYVHQSHSHQVNNDSVVAWEVYSCPKCGAVYENQAALERHKRSHGKDRPWACKVCDRRFKTKESLEWHMQRFMHHDITEDTLVSEERLVEEEEHIQQVNVNDLIQQQDFAAIKAETLGLFEDEIVESNELMQAEESIRVRAKKENEAQLLSHHTPNRRSGRNAKRSKKSNSDT